MSSVQTKVKVYTMDYCPYCERAKSLLKTRGIVFEEIRVANDDDATWDSLYKKAGMRTMPQILLGEKVIGGYSDLASMDSQDQLQSLK